LVHDLVAFEALLFAHLRGDEFDEALAGVTEGVGSVARDAEIRRA
jgi:hypothetical protein